MTTISFSGIDDRPSSLSSEPDFMVSMNSTTTPASMACSENGPQQSQCATTSMVMMTTTSTHMYETSDAYHHQQSQEDPTPDTTASQPSNSNVIVTCSGNPASVGDDRSSNSTPCSSNASKGEEDETSKDKEVRQAFPVKVYVMLEEAEDKGFAHIVSWNAMGDGFMVHEREPFIRDIVPNYFNQTRYKSFQRQLSLYGFQRITVGPQKGLRFHEKLRRGQRELLKWLKPVGYKPRGPPAPRILLEHVAHQQELQQQQKQAQIQFQHDSGAINVQIPMISSSSSIPTVVSSNSLDKQQEQTQGSAASVDASRCLGRHQHVQCQDVNGTPPIHKHQTDVATTQLSATYQEAKTGITTDPLKVTLFEGNSFYIMSSQQGAISAGLSTTSYPAASDGQGPPSAIMLSSSFQEMVSSQLSQADQLQKAWEIGFCQAAQQMGTTASSTCGSRQQSCLSTDVSTSNTTNSQVVVPSPTFHSVDSPAGQPEANYSATCAPTAAVPTHSSHLGLDECVDALDFHAIHVTGTGCF
jgi:HSF-type DNA-binding